MINKVRKTITKLGKSLYGGLKDPIRLTYAYALYGATEVRRNWRPSNMVVERVLRGEASRTEKLSHEIGTDLGCLAGVLGGYPCAFILGKLKRALIIRSARKPMSFSR